MLPGAPGLNPVAGAAAAAVARRRAGCPWSAEWWRAQFGSPARFREWITQELTTGRLLPWFAVAYGAGVVLYFAAEREPALWAAIALTGITALGTMLLTGRSCRKKSCSM